MMKWKNLLLSLRKLVLWNDLQELWTREWTCFRQFLKDKCSQKKLRELIQTLCYDSTLPSIYLTMTAMAKLCGVVTVHSTNVEWTFFQIITNIRNRTNKIKVHLFLRITIEEPPLQNFSATKAVSLRLTNNC